MSEFPENPYQAPAEEYTLPDQSGPSGEGPPNLEIGFLFNHGWQTFTANMGMAIALLAVTYGINFAVSMVGSMITNVVAISGVDVMVVLVLNVLFTFLSYFVSIPLAIGMGYGYLQMSRGQKVDISVMFIGFSAIYGTCLGAGLLYYLILMLGFLALIVPGIILALGLTFYGYLLVDRQLPALESLENSWAMTRGYKWQLFLVFLVSGLFAMLGLFGCLIGALFTAPPAAIMITKAYDELLRNYDDGGQGQPMGRGPVEPSPYPNENDPMP